MTPQEILFNILKAHELKVLEYKDWILVNEQLPAVRAGIQNYREYETGATIRLDISVLLHKKQVIWESFAGMGKDKLSAVQNAFQNFASNSLHVFLAAFWEVNDDEQVGIEEWEVNGELWNVYVGNFGCKGEYDIPKNLFNTIEEQIKSEELNEDIYWFRVYYANVSKEENMIETLKNNEVWSEMEDKIRNINWDKSDKFYSLRNFIILEKKKVVIQNQIFEN